MNSVSERQRNSDRISNLPDNLITHILSFLSTKDAVKTSILSTFWNQQWTLVPVIRFDESLPYHKRYSKSFVNIVDRFMLDKVTPLDLFQLTYGACKAKNISNWISAAISRHVRQIDVHASMHSEYPLPDCLYSTKTLVVLKLKGYFVFPVPEKISLVSLKILHYEAYNSEIGESFSKLVSGCPVLEELQIIGKLKENVKVLNISSLVLKRLIVKDQHVFWGNEHACKFVLNAPNLQYLELNDKYCVADKYHLNTLHCLDTARFRLFRFWPCNYDFLKAISNVRVLYILHDSFPNLYSVALPNFQMPKFNRLISLKLGHIESDAGLKLLIAFLQSSRQLESISFSLNSKIGTWSPPTDVPFCMIFNLKVIKVDYHCEFKLLLNVLTYFLEKTNCLEELILRPLKKDEEFIKKVSMLPRASNSCRVFSLDRISLHSLIFDLGGFIGKLSIDTLLAIIYFWRIR